ncbi:MAG: hypothetical protein LBS58_02370 [Coriobacteriales bacterium]|jgi:hypothetical protein|nr:hypothetical protein [Coriobacteriales bacterium]
MSSRPPAPSRAFFLELVLNLVIFSLCAAVCLQLFVSAKLASDESAALSNLAIEAQVVAEAFKSLDGDIDAVALSLDAQRDGDALLLYYDEEFKPVDAASAPYLIRCDIDTGTVLRTAAITVYQGPKELFSLEAKRYVAQGGGA